jgi:hypothetical protein
LIPDSQGTCLSSLQKHIFLDLISGRLPEIGECFLQISNMIFLLRAFHYDIINIGQHISAYLRMKDLGCHSAEASFNILEPLRHSKIAICAIGGYEASFWVILLFHPDLVVARVTIQ